MTGLEWLVVGFATVIVCTIVIMALRPNPLANPWGGVLYSLGGLYIRLVHRLTVRARAHCPTDRAPGPLIVVANHTAGIDPLLVSYACPFPIRWVMAQDMRLSWLEWFWRWQGVIFVGRRENAKSKNGLGSSGVRSALRHLERRGVIGIFPEGGIERPPERLRPFLGGVGTLIHKSGARVLPVWISGTPTVDPAWASLWHQSRSVVEFGPVIDYAEAGLSPREITRDLQRRYADWTTWPMATAGTSHHAPADAAPDEADDRVVA